MEKKYWTDKENEQVIQIHKLYTRAELAEIFNCTERQMYNKLRKLGLITIEIEEECPEGYKKCNVCGEIRLLDEFYNNKSKQDGKATECKHCSRATAIINHRKRKAEEENQNEELKKQTYTESLKGKDLECKYHGIQTIEDYRIYRNYNGNYSRKCKKCERIQQQRNQAKKLKEKGFF